MEAYFENFNYLFSTLLKGQHGTWPAVTAEQPLYPPVSLWGHRPRPGQPSCRNSSRWAGREQSQQREAFWVGPLRPQTRSPRSRTVRFPHSPNGTHTGARQHDHTFTLWTHWAGQRTDESTALMWVFLTAGTNSVNYLSHPVTLAKKFFRDLRILHNVLCYLGQT